MVIDLHPAIAALLLVLVAWFIARLTGRCKKCYNPEDFK